MGIINSILRTVTDLTLLPFRGMPPWVYLTLISTVGAVFALLVYKRVSNQDALVKVKDQIAAGFFEVRLFNDDLSAMLRAQGDLLKYNAKYMALNLVPFLWLSIPFILAMAQVQFHLGHKGLKAGDSPVLTVQLAGDVDPRGERPDLSLELPNGVETQSPGVWAPTANEMSWRLGLLEEGIHELVVKHNGQDVTKSLVVSEDWAPRRSPVRHDAGFLDQLLYPAEDPIPAAAGIAKIEIPYPSEDVAVFGVRLQWIFWFLILSLVVAFAIRGRMGVTF